MNDKLVIELESILNQELVLHEKLLHLSSRKREAISSDKIDELDRLNTIQKKVADDIEEKEQQRMGVTRELCQDLGIDPRSRLEKIIERIRDSHGDRLSELRRQLLKTIREIRMLNNINMELLRQMLGHITAFFDKLSACATSSPGYDSRGATGGKSGGNLMLNRVV